MFEIALALHQPNPRRMLKEMDTDLFTYWVAFLQRKQKEHDKKDYQLAQLTKVVAEMFSKGVNRPITEYLISFKTEEERLQEQDEKNAAFFRRLANLPGATVETVEYDS